jgi:hypothetical protein
MEVDDSGQPLVCRVDIDAFTASYKELTTEYVTITFIVPPYAHKLFYSYLVSLFSFVQAGGIVNPARVDPMLLYARQGYSKADSQTLELAFRDTKRIVSFATIIVSSGCKLEHGKEQVYGQNNIIYKYVAGFLSRGDGDRTEAFFPTSFGEESLYAEFNDGAMTFQTRNKRMSAPTPQASPVSKSSSMLGKLKLSQVAARPTPLPANVMSGFDFNSTGMSPGL